MLSQGMLSLLFRTFQVTEKISPHHRFLKQTILKSQLHHTSMHTNPYLTSNVNSDVVLRDIQGNNLTLDHRLCGLFALKARGDVITMASRISNYVRSKYAVII